MPAIPIKAMIPEDASETTWNDSYTFFLEEANETIWNDSNSS